MSWDKVKLSKVLKQYRVTHIVQNDRDYKQVTISKHDGVKFRGIKNGKEIGRKRQFIIDLKNYPNTLMLVRQGVYDGAIGIAPIEVDGCIATENMPMFSIEGINIDYLNLILQSPYFKEELEKIPTTGSAQKSIHERQILEIEIPFPSAEIQDLVVKSFKKNRTGINEISTELTHQLDLVKQLRQSFLREAMQGQLVPQDPKDEPASVLLEKIKAEKERLIKEKKLKKQKPLSPITEDEIPFDIPENWVWCRLGEACLKITDGTHHSPTNTPKGDFMYVTAKNIKDEGVDLSNITYVTKDVHHEIYSRCDPEFGDILYIKDGATTGIVTVNDLDDPFSLLSSVALLKLDDNVYNRFLMYVMRSPVYYDATRNNMYGVALTRVTLAKINNSIIPLPPLSEQQRIVRHLDELMQYCDELEISIKESQQQNELLLQQVLREALEPKEKEVEKV
tara:strand:+ start:7063 stop:8412 length:1350 start_codon:yes stop_codon:yes gene_type:complete